MSLVTAPQKTVDVIEGEQDRVHRWWRICTADCPPKQILHRTVTVNLQALAR
jgi:hypothetical protein